MELQPLVSVYNELPLYIQDINHIGKMFWSDYNYNDYMSEMEDDLFNEWNNNEGGFYYEYNYVSNMFISYERGNKIRKFLKNDYFLEEVGEHGDLYYSEYLGNYSDEN
tara:strand:+ start:367 stop:690 length:324 start_codon:yes stop_codon:yes gene_type:complete